MTRWLSGLAALAAASMALAVPAQAEKRVALVIGNNDYKNVPKLQKAVNDARTMGDTLKQLGFSVMVAENQTRAAFSQTLLAFDAALLNPLFQGNRPAKLRVHHRIACRHAAHRGRRGAMAIGATAPGAAGGLRPQRFALLHPEEARIARIIVLHGAGFRAGVLIARTLLCRGKHHQAGESEPPDHST